MRIRSGILMRYFVLMFLSLLLTACATSTSSTPPANPTSSHGESSVVPQTTPTPTQVQGATPTAGTGNAPSGIGNAYAFVRASQLWVAINGAKPVQATHFDFSSAGPNPNIFFGQPLWFANDRYVAFTLAVLGAGLGGGGCGFTGDYGRNGALFVLDTTNMQIAQVSVSGEQSSVGPSLGAYRGYWEFLFFEDATHLLAWHNDSGLKGAGGLYRYDLNARTLTLTIPSSSVPGADNQEAWYPMRYSSGQLYYETMNPAYGNNTVYTIYSHSISNPGTPSTKVLDVGSEPFCAGQVGNTMVTGPFTEPGWDVSLDGKYLAAQTMVTNGSTTTGSVKVLMLSLGTTLTLFAQAPAQVLSHDASLSWSQDGQTVVLKSLISQITLYSVTLSSPTTMQTYNTNSIALNTDRHLVHMVWHGDGGVFALFSWYQCNLNSGTNSYSFIVGQPNGTLLLANACNFVWG